MAKRESRTTKKAKKLLNGDILTPIKISDIGGGNDPCFGKLYDLTTSECKMCGDSELCCIKTAEFLGKSRKELEQVNEYKDLDNLVDKQGAKKYFRQLKRKGLEKKDIIQKLSTKYELTLKETRTLYREFNK